MMKGNTGLEFKKNKKKIKKNRWNKKLSFKRNKA